VKYARRYQRCCHPSADRSSRAPNSRIASVAWGLALLLVFVGGCGTLHARGTCESPALGMSDHEGEAHSYQEAALRILADSNRHSVLAVQYAEKAASGSDTSMWQDLAEYHLQLAAYELNVAGRMVAIAVVHRQLAHGSQPVGKREGAP